MIYLIAERESKRPDWLTYQRSFMVKMGYTAQLDCSGRIGDLQTGNPRELVVITTMNGSKTDELALHHWARNYRQVGEWFLLPASVVHYARRAGSVARLMASVDLPALGCVRARPAETRHLPAESEELKALLDKEFGYGWAAATAAVAEGMRDALDLGLEDPAAARSVAYGTRNGTRNNPNDTVHGANHSTEAA